MVTEFIGIALGLGVLGVPRGWARSGGGGGDGRRRDGGFPRFDASLLVLVFGSLVFVPVFMMVHPPWEAAHDVLAPHFPAAANPATSCCW